jgi:hypothetical protein
VGKGNVIDHANAIGSTVALPCDPQPSFAAGTRRVAAPSRPDSDRAEADAAKTTFLQARGVPVILTRERREGACSGAGMHFRGADKPGRRAVLEEINSTSDLSYSTLTDLYSQVKTADCAKFSYLVSVR